MPVKYVAAVVSEGLWHNAQPMVLNNALPFNSEALAVVGAGGAARRMKIAKLATSEDPPETAAWSSGVGLKTQPGTPPRSFGKISFETPCSTLYASPAKISRDLFCAFQPKRVTVPSLPLVFSLPKMPRADLADWFDARLACSTASGVFSTSPSPKVGVGMRKTTL